jgi:hypothetical protein
VKEIHLQPARSLLESLSADDLKRLALKAGIRIRPGSRLQFIKSITARLDIEGLVETLGALFPGTGPASHLGTIDRLTGSATVQTCSPTDPSLGELLLEDKAGCLALRLPDFQLFLENRWPVLAREVGPVPHARLFAGFVRPGCVHPDAEMAPPRNNPFIVDEGEYGLRNARLRLDLRRAGPISFAVTLLRRNPKTRGNEYLLEPIA